MGGLPVLKFDPLNIQKFSDEALKVIEFITNYYKNVQKYPVRSQVEPGFLQNVYPKTAPLQPTSLETILQEIQNDIIPGITHWQSPNFFAFFPATISNAAFHGEMLCTALNVVGFNWICSPAATELEMIVMDWLAKLFNLPQSFLFAGEGGGVIQGSTSEGLICVLSAARDKALKQFGEDAITKLVVYASDQTHFVVQKAAKLVGIPSKNFRVIPTSLSNQFAVTPKAVEVAVERDVESGLMPFFLCATVGATPSGSTDPIEGLGLLAQKYGLWFHIDAAYAGSALICPELRHYLIGTEHANSISMNLHKWFLTNLDCSGLWVKNRSDLLDTLSMTAEVMRNDASESKNVVDFMDWQIASGRRFRALKLWLVLRRYGVQNLMIHIRSDIELAKHLEALVKSDQRFEVVVPVKFSLVCFRLKPEKQQGEESLKELNWKLMEAVNSSGRAYMTHAVLGDIFVIRCAIGTSLTEEKHVNGLWELIQEKTQLVLKERLVMGN
ncbi:Tryptophan decarboxylase [Heracleum sosnowskyi]|uniref:Tryptophan decarboxylase n=1 Tax=Heracleum sosnowskyi TaxID=360622 RepID=A0AAD8N8J8_9APIA|nr:Tryptophan decarboxylase [Heracleum sosnowskyi]